MADIIDGKAIAAELLAHIQSETKALIEKYNVTPGLAVVLVGDNPASQVYVRSKGKRCVEAGMASIERKLPAETSQEKLLEVIEELNNDASVHGILVQLPLPGGLDEAAVINAISPDKDVDGFHVSNVGRLSAGLEGMIPCTPLGCMIMLKRRFQTLAGKEAVVLGRSNIVGKPMAQLLLAQHATVTVAHSRSPDIEAICARADVLVAAVGRPQLVKASWVKSGATVIDVGINRIPAPEKGEGGTRIVGDVDFDEVEKVAGAITPAPGGVGPMTIACLLANTLTACRKSVGAPAASSQSWLA